MRVPKLRCVFSPPLMSLLVKERVNIREDVNKFKKLLAKYEEEILKTISDLIGCEWEEEDINIYVAPSNAHTPSLSYPLILKIRKDPYINLYFLIHELIHRFFHFSTALIPFSENFHPKIDYIKSESITDFLTRKVAEKIFGKKKAKELRRKEQSIVTSRDLKKCEELVREYELKYDINKKSLIKYWQETT